MTENTALKFVQSQPQEIKPKSYRFDIFKGVKDASDKIHKIKSVGSAHVIDGCKTYTVHLKTFLNDVFYLLPESKKTTDADFVILTREPSQTVGRKYFWNNIGEGEILTGENTGFVNLRWDVLGVEDLYMNLYPKEGTFESEAVRVLKEVVTEK
jgi:hypothetical protein